MLESDRKQLLGDGEIEDNDRNSEQFEKNSGLQLPEKTQMEENKDEE